MQLSALLFDMDGTILTSIPATIRCWSAWARRVGLEPEFVLDRMHGRRAEDSIAELCPPGRDIAEEVAWLDAAEHEDLEGIEPIPGAKELLTALPRGSWAVVTSANPVLARKRIAAAGLPLPQVLVSSVDVTRGKPDPMGYRLGAERLGVETTQCLVFEDAEAGLQAGRASGAHVLRIAGGHAGPGWLTIPDYSAISITETPGGLAYAGPDLKV